MSLPPAYSTDSVHASFPEPETLEPPTYTPRLELPHLTQTGRQPRKEFTGNLSKKGIPWAVLTILGDTSLSPSIPTILEGSDIVGSVKLNLDKEDGIHSVVVLVKGRVITGPSSGEQFRFLDLVTTLWSKSTSDPESTLNDRGQRHGTKLEGEYLWPFTISLPKEVVITAASKSAPQIFRLPQSFLERNVRVSIQYNINLCLARGKLLRDYRTSLIFGYVPVAKPDPPSPLRQLAYQENRPILGPGSDPDGWRTLDAVTVWARIGNTRVVDVKCMLSLATPLCYTRGSVIPCSIVIETKDLQTLGILSSPDAIVVRLRRCIITHADTGKSSNLSREKDIVEYSQPATWWLSTEGAPDASTSRFKRQINGELHLSVNLKPTSAMAHFRIEYSVVLFPFNAIGFDSESTGSLCTVPIVVATSYAAGPRPRTYTPPGYEAPRALTSTRATPLHRPHSTSSWM